MVIATTNPTTGKVERTYPPHSAEEVARRLDHAHEATAVLRESTFANRARWMHAAADIVEAEIETTARMLTTEMGKPITQARGEVAKCAKAMRFYADNAEKFLADAPLDDPASVGATSAWTRFEPLGVVLAVMPWNYPLWQVVRFAAPALMAGNVGLLKHASNVPQAASYLDDLFERAGFPAGAFQALFISARKVEAVVRDQRIAAVTLTGSEPAGRSVAETAGSEVKKTVLELGGSDPFIVMPSADLDKAASVAVAARVTNNGQSCIAAKRFIVHEEVYDDFIELFVDKTAALRVGDPADEATDVGPIATASARQDLVDLVDDAMRAGATLKTGGQTPEGPGWFFTPAVLENVTKGMRLYHEEAFGPVATVFRVADATEAVSIANDTTFGLSSAVWTNDDAEGDFFISTLQAGAVFINGMTVSYPELPFGGIKDSGIGRELAAEGIREFCNLKTVWKSS
jgi:succinate-semialdehyde dehydrogenase/glutarate-semialdehyde dehydrogenase